MTTRRLGRLGERAAARFLQRVGHKILLYNWRCRYGEVDLVTMDKKELVIVEVKTRSSDVAEWYPALSAIDRIKQQKLIKLSQFLWDRRGAIFPQLHFKNFRIDVVTVTTEPLFFFGLRSQIQYLPHVFRL